MKPHYDYLIVGAGLFGSVVAWRLARAGRRVKVIDRRDHTGGNLRCEDAGGITVHRYGPHIFHTSNEEVWRFVNRFVRFNDFVNSPVANYKGRLFHLPFNMNTFEALWGVTTAEQAQAKIAGQRAELDGKTPQNLEEQAIALVGRDIYETLVKGYTEKQWGRPCRCLPAEIIRRLPVRFTYDNNYFNDRFQGIPEGGYNPLIEKLLEGADVQLDCDFFECRAELEACADRIVYTGEIDRFYDYRFGRLEYRSLRFESERVERPDYQGVAVMNYTDAETPWTRIVEHKHFDAATAPLTSHTVITREYPAPYSDGCEPYYPVNDARNSELYSRYAALAATEKRVRFGGRLAEYRYYDMDKVVERALAFCLE